MQSSLDVITTAANTQQLIETIIDSNSNKNINRREMYL